MVNQYSLLLYCDKVPNCIKKLRKKYDDHKLSAHITLGYLININDSDKNYIISILNKIKKFELKLDTIVEYNDLIALKMNNTKLINNIIKKIDNCIDKLPKSGFHLTILYSRGNKYTITTKIKEEIKNNIKLPIRIKINKIWLMKRNKIEKQDWFRSKTIFLH
tara:strand:- start:36 stop:524 length:489 start_codon:yes stop_codon:yes gene_type:complete